MADIITAIEVIKQRRNDLLFKHLPGMHNQLSHGRGGGAGERSMGLPKIKMTNEAEKVIQQALNPSSYGALQTAENGPSGMLWGEGLRSRLLQANGVTNEAIQEMDHLFDHHRWGEGNQAVADKQIAEAINQDTPLGHALRTQVAIETELMERWESARPKLFEVAEKQSKKEMKEAWETGRGPKNEYAYNSWEEQWDVEESYKFHGAKEPVQYHRKGGMDKDVLSTSLSEAGAQSYAVIGSQENQPHFESDHHWTSKQLKDAGYKVLGGFGYTEMGYQGEFEITWVKYK